MDQTSKSADKAFCAATLGASGASTFQTFQTFQPEAQGASVRTAKSSTEKPKYQKKIPKSPVWNITETILDAFINFLEARESKDPLTKEEREDWVKNHLRPSVCPDDIPSSNHLRCVTWDDHFGDSEFWGLLFQVHYRDINNGLRTGERCSRYPIMYLEPNYSDPRKSKLYVVRRGLLHSIEALSRRQIASKIEANDSGLEQDQPVDPCLVDLVSFVQGIPDSTIKSAYLSCKHDGVTAYVTCITTTHPAYAAVCALLKSIPDGFGHQLIEQSHFEFNGVKFLMLIGTTSQLVVTNPEMMAYHATAFLATQGQTYNGTDTPFDLMLKSIPYVVDICGKVLNVLLLKGLLASTELLKDATFGLMFESCVPNRTAWGVDMPVHHELTMVYPEGRTYLFGVWCPSLPEISSRDDSVYGKFIPHTDLYDDLRELGIPQPLAFEVSSAELIDTMVTFLNGLLTRQVNGKSLYDMSCELSNEFIATFHKHLMGFGQNLSDVHPMDLLVSFEGFCVFAWTAMDGFGRWEYVKVKLDDYYLAHKHSLNAIQKILGPEQVGSFANLIFGQYRRVFDLHGQTKTDAKDLVEFLRLFFMNSTPDVFKDLVGDRIALETTDASRAKTEKNLRGPFNKGAFYGTLLGVPGMLEKIHAFFGSHLNPFWTRMGLDMAELETNAREENRLMVEATKMEKQYKPSAAYEVWYEYLNSLKAMGLYFGKTDVTTDKGVSDFVQKLSYVVIKLHVTRKTHTYTRVSKVAAATEGSSGGVEDDAE
jgi:hypothetical protein